MSKKETTEAILAEAADVIEETLDVIDNTPAIIEYKNDPLILAGVALIGLTTGAFVGYRLAKRYLEPKYAALADEEIKAAKVLYGHLHKDDYESPSVAVEKLIPDSAPEAQAAMRKYQGQDVHILVEEDALVVTHRVDQTENVVEETPADPEPRTETHFKNVFDQQEEPVNDGPQYEGWDYDTELARRTDSKPFVVTKEEFFENEFNLEVMNVTYYTDDEVLADQSDGIIDAIDSNVGWDNLKKFGVASGEEHIVYIFNKKAGLAFEVARHQGKYSVDVMGFDDDETTERMPRRGRRLGD